MREGCEKKKNMWRRGSGARLIPEVRVFISFLGQNGVGLKSFVVCL